MISLKTSFFNNQSWKINLFLFATLTFTSQMALAKLHNFETTRLKSTAGTGVGSILLDESSILNPASIVFFGQTSFYIQRYSQKYMAENNQNSTLARDYSKRSESFGAIISEAQGAFKGSLSYQKQKEGKDDRQRFAFSLGTNLGEVTAGGIMLNKTVDKVFIQNDQKIQKNNYYQLTLGIIHSINEQFTLGLLVSDLFKARSEDTLLTIGAQYVFYKIVALMVDGGMNYRQDFTQTLFYRGAAQFNIFSDFYLRLGAFYDLGRQEQGNGAGLAWVTPGISLEAALKNIAPYKGSLSTSALGNSKIQEFSLSMSYRF